MQLWLGYLATRGTVSASQCFNTVGALLGPSLMKLAIALGARRLSRDGAIAGAMTASISACR